MCCPQRRRHEHAPGSLQDVEPAWTPRRPAAHRAPLVAMLRGFEPAALRPMQPALPHAMCCRAARDAERRPDRHRPRRGEDGALLVHTAQGMQAVTSAEISVRPAVLSTL